MSLGINGNFNGGQFFARHLCNFIGETVTIFTASGGLSGNGFTGVILAVNCDFVRLVTKMGSAPTCPISDICDNDNEFDNGCGRGRNNGRILHEVGSVCDIPIHQIVSFCHNAV